MVRKHNFLNNRELGWLEGIVDGEGCFNIAKNKNKRGGYAWVVRLQIGSTDFRICKKVQSIMNGSISEVMRHGNCKNMFLYQSHIGSLRVFLPRMKLVSKERQRVIILRTLHLIRKYPIDVRKTRGRERPDILNMKMEILKTRLHRLNAIGREVKN